MHTASGKQIGSKMVTANHILPFRLLVDYCPSRSFQTCKTAHAFTFLAFDITFYCLAIKKMSQEVMYCRDSRRQNNISTYAMATHCRDAFRGCETQICASNTAFLRSGFKS